MIKSTLQRKYDKAFPKGILEKYDLAPDAEEFYNAVGIDLNKEKVIKSPMAYFNYLITNEAKLVKIIHDSALYHKDLSDKFMTSDFKDLMKSREIVQNVDPSHSIHLTEETVSLFDLIQNLAIDEILEKIAIMH